MYTVSAGNGRLSYEGRGVLVRGKPNGRWVGIWNGRRYDGEYRDGKRHGHGALTLAGGHRYEGEWRDDKLHGYGITTWVDGERYEGEYRDGKKHGHGTQTWPSGAGYEGEFRDGSRTDRERTLGPTPRYDGDHRDGKPHGRGTHTWADGGAMRATGGTVISTGAEFTLGRTAAAMKASIGDGKKHGHGTRTWADGTRYEGDWHDGKTARTRDVHLGRRPPLRGPVAPREATRVRTLTRPDGERFEGQWRDGCFQPPDGRWAVVNSTPLYAVYEWSSPRTHTQATASA